MKHILLVVIVALSFSGAFAQNQVSVNNMAKHMGEIVIISDRISNITYNQKLKETYLTIGSNQPNQNLTIVIKANAGEQLNNWAKSLLPGQDVRVSGKLYQYKRQPAILVTDALQLKLLMVDNVVQAPFGQF